MKSNFTYPLFLLFLTFSIPGFAQQNDKAAFQKYKQARDAYENNNFSNAANLLIETKSLLGETNIRIQPMLIKSLVNIQNWNRANEEIDKYYGLNPDQNLVEYQEIVKIDRQVDIKVKEDQELYESAKNTRSVTEMERYLSKFPHGKYREEVKILLATQRDENAWQIAKSDYNTRAYELYITKFPEGIHAQEANSKITKWDEQAFNEAKDKGTQAALNYYLRNFPNGEHRSQISSLLTERKEEDAYAATNSGNLGDFEAYIRKYPNGKYSSQINKAIEDYLFEKAENLYDHRFYISAIDEYQAYINRFPNAENINTAQRKLRKAEKKADQYSSGYFGFTYESQGAIGITGGKLKKDKLGLYYNLRATPEVIDNQWSEAEMIIPENQIPEENKIGLASLSAGFSYPVLYPLWFYVGGGASYQERFIEENDENLYFQVEDEEQLALFPEAGLNFRLSRSFVLLGGAAYIRNEVFYKGGLAFNF
ncbi:outer membrane protein assembly factor BamD [Salegentibacter sp. F14]